MTRHSSISITYSDLVKWAEKKAAYEEQRLTRARSLNENCERIVKDVECAKTLVRILKKCEPGKQADLFEIYEKLKL